MSLSSKKTTHFLFSAFPGWGHIRPFCIFAARLVKENENVVVTLLLTPNLLRKAQLEISSEFNDETPRDTLKRIRVFSPFKSDSEDPFILFPFLVKTYPAIYRGLLNTIPSSCSSTGEIFDSVPAPSIIILDFIAHPLIAETRAISGNSVPIISWVTGHVSAVVQLFVPDLELDATPYGSANGTIVRVPGLPNMYDWEFFPQEVPSEIDISVLLNLGHRGLVECDAAFITSAFAVEKVSIAALKSWFSEKNQESFVIGPLVPPIYIRASDTSAVPQKVEEFLRKVLEGHGEKSLILISFGTVFWPTRHEYINEIIEALIEKSFPFILCYASPFANISDELISRINNSALGLVSKWVPQQHILNHPATGWFMTHAGHNSVMESLGSGIPMICWPFEGDQPASAAHLSVNLNVAFELIEVRTGIRGLRPLLRSGAISKGTTEAVGEEIRNVIQACRGAKGKELQKNAKRIKTELGKTWDAEVGISRREVRAFFKKFGLDMS